MGCRSSYKGTAGDPHRPGACEAVQSVLGGQAGLIGLRMRVLRATADTKLPRHEEG